MSLVNVGELMTDPDFARRFTLRRPRTTTFANEGEAQASYGETSVIGVVQPATDREVQMLPEGTRLKKIIAVWSAERLSPGDGASLEPDVLIVDRESFKVIKCEPWVDNGYWYVLAEGFVPS